MARHQPVRRHHSAVAAIMRTAFHVFVASVIAGFGLAFGRDIYKETKRNWPIIAITLLALSFLIGLFYSGILIVRSYDTRSWSIIGRFGGVVLFIVCYGTLLGIINIFDPLHAQHAGSSGLLHSEEGESYIYKIYAVFWRFDGEILNAGSAHNILFILQNLILLVGVAIGVRERYQAA